MWSPVALCCLLVASSVLANSSNNDNNNGSGNNNRAWKQGQQYEYQIKGRTLAALHDVADQYTGTLIRATLKVQPRNQNSVVAWVTNAKYSDVHANLTNGWKQEIPDKHINYQNWQLSEKPFVIEYKNGVVKNLQVNQNCPTWELNIIKSIVSQLQVDTKAENEVSSRLNQKPKNGKPFGTWNTMEDTVTGECQTLYDIKPLQQVEYQNKPQLAPMPNLKGSQGDLIDIMKTKNFSMCDTRIDYHFGVPGSNDAEPSSNYVPNFLSRSSTSRVIIAGDLSHYTIQSAVTTDKIVISPELYNKQKGMVVSQLNITLSNVHSAAQNNAPALPSNLKKVQDLIYEYNPASSDESAQNNNGNNKHHNNDNNNDSSSSSSSSSSDSSSSSSSSSSSDSSSSSSSDSSSSSSSDSSNSSSGSSESNESNQGGNRRRTNSNGHNNKNHQNENGNSNESQNNKNLHNGNNNSNENGNKRHNNDNSNESQNKRSNRSRRSIIRNLNNEESNENNNNNDSNNAEPMRHNNKNSGSQRNMNNDSNGSDNYNNKKWQQNGDSSSSSSSSDSSSSSSSSSESGSSSSSSSSSSSDSSSSEENYQPEPRLNQAPQSPFLPYFIGNKGNSIQSSKQIDAVSACKSLAQQIGQEIQDPNSMNEHKTLSKFTILAGVVRTMNAKQLESATHELYYQQNKASSASQSDANKLTAWKAYRDAVAQAGTGPTLVAMKQWIESGKVEGEEAAELLAVLPNTARYPTREYIKELFNLAISSQVTKQHYLNTSAILSVTSLARKAQVDSDNSHNQYPVHAFGRLSAKNSKDVTERYAPYLANKLKEATRNQDSLKAQVYIRALGNLGHPVILSVFKPYLEGKAPATNYQRLAMVSAMDQVARLSPKSVQSSLFNIYQNTGESHELRCAAVFQLMKTNPSAQLLQRMAAFTEQDMSKQVNSAVKSAIESAAELKCNKCKIAENAKAAMKMLSPKTYGLQYSKNYLSSYAMKEENLAYRKAFSTIGSEDSILPKGIQLNLKRVLGGLEMEKDRFRAMTASVSDLLGLLENQFSTEESRRQEKNAKASSNNNESQSTKMIAQMLNIKREQAEQVEAQIFATIFGGNRLFTFDNHTVENIPRKLKAAAAHMQNGQSFNYTKMYNSYVVNIGFPTAMGLPFQYSYKKTNLISVGGEMKLKTHPNAADANEHKVNVPQSANISCEAQLLYAGKGQAKISFITPYNQQRYIAGTNKYMQVNIPIKAQADIDVQNNQVALKLEPLNKNREEKVLIATQHPYTAIQNILNLTPVEKSQNTKDINVRRPREWTQTYGEHSTGVAMKVHYNGEDNNNDLSALYKKMQDHDLTTAIFFTNANAEINRNRFIVSYDAQKSSTKAIRFYATYRNNEESRLRNSDKNNNNDNSSNNNSGPLEARATSAIPSSASRNGAEKRQEELLHKACAGIKDAAASVVEIMAEFEGNNNAQYVATAALARSPVDKNSKFLFFYHASPAQSSKFEMAVAASAQVPKLSEMNFMRSEKEDPSMQINVEAMWGENAQSGAQVSIKAKLEQSQERKEFIAKHPQAEQCRKEMEQRDNALPACRNITARANALDEYTFTIKYEKIPQKLMNATYQLYRFARYAGFAYNSENLVEVNNQANQLRVRVNFADDLQTANVSIEAPHANAQFKDLPVNFYAKQILVQHAQYNIDQRVGFGALNGQYNPVCVADGSSAQTFDNKTYPLNLEKDSWYVLMTSAPKQRKDNRFDYKTQRNNNVTILVKQAGDNKKEVKVVLNNGEHVIDMQPAGSSSNNDANSRIQVNKKDQKASKNSVNEVTDNQNQRICQIYALPSGEVVVKMPEHGLTFNYDGSRVIVEANDRYRDAVRGLCGSFTGEKATDFMTPRNCVLRESKDFISTYSLNNAANKDNAKYSNQEYCAPQKMVQFQQVINEKHTGRWADAKRLKLQSSFGYFNKHNGNSDSNQSNDYNDSNNSSNNNRRNSRHAHNNRNENSNENNSYKNSHNRNNNHNNSNENNHNQASTRHMIRVTEQGNQLCFTAKTMPQCNNGYRAENTAEKKVDAHCVNDGQQARQWRDQARRGDHIAALQRRNTNKQITIEVPTKCIAA